MDASACLICLNKNVNVWLNVFCSEAAAHAVATLAEATLQGGGQIVLAETAAAVGALAGVQDATGTYMMEMIFKRNHEWMCL